VRGAMHHVIRFNARRAVELGDGGHGEVSVLMRKDLDDFTEKNQVRYCKVTFAARWEGRQSSSILSLCMDSNRGMGMHILACQSGNVLKRFLFALDLLRTHHILRRNSRCAPGAVAVWARIVIVQETSAISLKRCVSAFVAIRSFGIMSAAVLDRIISHTSVSPCLRKPRQERHIPISDRVMDMRQEHSAVHRAADCYVDIWAQAVTRL